VERKDLKPVTDPVLKAAMDLWRAKHKLDEPDYPQSARERHEKRKEFDAHEIFSMRGKIVHRENFGVDIEKPVNREVCFVIPQGSDFVRCQEERDK